MQQKTSLTLSPDRREAAVCGTASFPCGAYFIDIALYPASAISWVLAAIIFVITAIQFAYNRHKDKEVN